MYCAGYEDVRIDTPKYIVIYYFEIELSYTDGKIGNCIQYQH